VEDKEGETKRKVGEEEEVTKEEGKKRKIRSRGRRRRIR
jgi:hypothetical protein